MRSRSVGAGPSNARVLVLEAACASVPLAYLATWRPLVLGFLRARSEGRDSSSGLRHELSTLRRQALRPAHQTRFCVEYPDDNARGDRYKRNSVLIYGAWAAKTCSAPPVRRAASRAPVAGKASGSRQAAVALVVLMMYALVCRLFELVLLLARGERSKELENLVLRHESSILRRQTMRPPFTLTDRLLLAALSRVLPRRSWGAFLVRPETLLRWQRRLVARHWT